MKTTGRHSSIYKKYPSPTHVTPNAHISYAISQAKGSVTGFNTNTALHTDQNITDSITRTESDSHDNTAVLGKNTLIIADTGKTAHVTPFTPNYKSTENVIFDGAIAYDCPYSRTSYILLIHNALYVPSMAHTLIPPFVMR